MAYGIRRKKNVVVETFWKNGHKKYGYTEKGVRDEVTTDDKGNVHYFLWGNRIATHNKKKNQLIVRDTGWKTHTTKDRLNSILLEKRLGSVESEKGKWIIFRNGKKFEWSDKDNVFDLKNPEKYLKPFEEEKLKLQLKETAKKRKAFIESIKKELKQGKLSGEHQDLLFAIMRKRGYQDVGIILKLEDQKRFANSIMLEFNWFWKQPEVVKEEIYAMRGY